RGELVRLDAGPEARGRAQVRESAPRTETAARSDGRAAAAQPHPDASRSQDRLARGKTPSARLECDLPCPTLRRRDAAGGPRTASDDERVLGAAGLRAAACRRRPVASVD